MSWLGFALFFIVAVMSSSCSKDKGVIDTSSKDTLYVKSVSTSPDTADIINDPVWDQAEEFSIRIGEDADYTNDLKLGVVRTKAVADTAYIYMRFYWLDSTMSVRPGYWTNQVGPDCAVWTQNADTNCLRPTTLSARAGRTRTCWDCLSIWATTGWRRPIASPLATLPLATQAISGTLITRPVMAISTPGFGAPDARIPWD